jgi:ribosomal protein S21
MDLQPKKGKVSYFGNNVKVINGNIDEALRRLKGAVKDSGVMFELKQRQEFLPPSAIKREVKQKAIRKQQLISLREKEDRLI